MEDSHICNHKLSIKIHMVHGVCVVHTHTLNRKDKEIQLDPFRS